MDHSVNARKGRDILGLANVARDAIQDQDVVLREADTVEETVNYFFRKRKMLVFKKEPAFENTLDKVKVITIVLRCIEHTGHKSAKF